MKKTDFKKSLPHLYGEKSREFVEIDVPEMAFLKIDGAGDPNTAEDYRSALETLFPVAYKAKFLSKKSLEKDYVVPPLEGLWWSDDMASFAEERDKSKWKWTMMIMQPDWITADMIGEAKAAVSNKCPEGYLGRLRFETYAEGLSLQCLHIGSYDDEGPVLHKLHHEVMPGLGYGFNGLHHEIYLSDPRRVAPEKMKTILRQPVSRTK